MLALLSRAAAATRASLGPLTQQLRHATKKAGGTGGVTRTSKPKYLGVKILGDQPAKAGSIIVRQRGTKYYPGQNVGLGKDHTIFATQDGAVKFHTGRLNRMFVSVLPAAGSEGPSPEPAPAE